MNFPSLPIGLSLTNNEVCIFEIITDGNGKRKTQNLKCFPISEIKELGYDSWLYTFSIKDKSFISNNSSLTYADMNGIWRLQGLLENTEFDTFYFKECENELFE
jgi:hypothetical protein